MYVFTYNISIFKGFEVDYDISELPSFAAFLANAVMLTKESIKQRILWMISKEVDFNFKSNSEQQTSTLLQIKYLIKDLADYYKNDHIIGWQKIPRYFLLGFLIESYHEDKISKEKKKDKDDMKKRIISDTIEDDFETNKKKILLQSKKSILNTVQIKDVINDCIKQIVNSILSAEEDYNFVMAQKELTKNLNDSIVFSYLFYYFVKMFGYIALISPPSTSQSTLLKYFKFKDYKIMIDNFKHFRRSSLGDDIINANTKHGSTILKVVASCATNLNINNDNFQKKLNDIKNNYLLKKLTEENNDNYRNSKKQRIYDHTANSESESLFSSKSNRSNKVPFNYGSKSRKSRKGKGRINNDEIEYYQFDLNNIKNKFDKQHDLQITALKEQLASFKNSMTDNNYFKYDNDNNISQHAQYAGSSKLNDDKNQSNFEEKFKMPDIKELKPVDAKSNEFKFHYKNYNFEKGVNDDLKEEEREDMLKTLNEINLGLNENIFNKLKNDAVKMFEDNQYPSLNFNEDDKLLIITYHTLTKYTDKNQILSEKERIGMIEAIEGFKDGINSEMKEFIDLLSIELKNDDYRSESDKKLLSLTEAIDLCINDPKINKQFYSLASDNSETDDEEMDLDKQIGQE